MKGRIWFWPAVVLVVVCLGLLGSRVALLRYQSWYWKASSNPEFFSADVDGFAVADRDHPPPEHPIVFVGSSSIRQWDTLQADMAPLAVLNRGFGGAQLSSVVHFVDRVVIRYRPRAVVLYAGDNDLDAGKSPADVVREFDAFVLRVQAALPDTRIYYLSMKPSLQLWANWPRYRQANVQIAAICATHPGLVYIDVATPLLAYGEPPPRELYRFDRQHLSAKGYALWTAVIKSRLSDDLGR